MKSKKGVSARGRPSKFTAEVAQAICARLSAGETLRTICKGKDMPDHSTVMGWVRDSEAFSNQYARAREIGFAAMADDLVDIADDKTGDAARDRLRVDTRKWLLSKALPKVYGDKLQVDATHHHDITSLSDEDIARELLNRGVEGGGPPARNQG